MRVWKRGSLSKPRQSTGGLMPNPYDLAPGAAGRTSNVEKMERVPGPASNETWTPT